MKALVQQNRTSFVGEEAKTKCKGLDFQEKRKTKRYALAGRGQIRKVHPRNNDFSRLLVRILF